MKSPEQPTLREWLEAEPFTLAMSSGFFGFYAHAGVLEALCESDLGPSAIRGSSAGGLVTALWAAGMEPGQVNAELTSLQRGDFWDPGPGAGLLRGRLLDQKLRGMVTIDRIEDCALPVHISVFDLATLSTNVLDHGDIVLAGRATCAVPGLFQPVKIDGRYKLDGGIKDHAGYLGAPSSERIFHHRLLPRRADRRNVLPEGRSTIEQPNRCVFEVRNLVHVTPFSLRKGMLAYEQAKSLTLNALDQPMRT